MPVTISPLPHDPVIPQAQSARIAAIRDVHWEALDESLDTLDEQIANRARLSMARIRQSGYNPRVIKRETRKIATHTNSITSSALAGQVEAAALYAQRAADVIRAWQIAGRIKEGVEHLTVSPSAFARATRPGVSAIDAEAALSRIKTSVLRIPGDQRRALAEFGAKQARSTYTGPSTSGTRIMDKLRKLGLVKKSPEIGLSERLHGAAARNIAETEKAVGTAIREAKNMNRAGRDLIRAVNSGGDQLSVNRKLTKPLLRLKRAGRKLQALSINQADPDALKAATQEFNKSFAQIRKVASKLVDRRGGYQELIQIIEKQGVKGMDSALTRWLDEKQAFHSERIVETETSAAYRAREAQQHSNKPYITGFWWRRNPGMVSLDLKRKRDIAKTRPRRKGGKRGKRKTKGRPCTVCPALADQRFPVEYAREYPRGAHPMCRCWYEWIYDQGKLDSAPVTQGDLDWFENLGD